MLLNLSILILSSVISIFGAVPNVAPSSKCPEAHCVCGRSNGTVEVVCDRGGLSDRNLAKLISLIPKDVTVIRLEAPLANPNNFSLTQDFARFARLTELHFVNGGLSSLGKRTFEKLKFLKILNLSGNRIDTLSPDTFANMEQLQQLSLSRNALNLRGKLPTGTFAYLRNLHTLDMSENSLGEFASNLFSGLRNLRALNLTGNSIGENFDVLYDLPNLHTLDLADCQLNGRIPTDAFVNNGQLRRLNFAGNQLTSANISALKNTPKLEYLNLANNYLKVVAKSSFNAVPNLKSLNLAGNFLGVQNLQTIFHEGAFDGVQNLEELNLANNSFAYFDSSNLNTKSLRSLDLSSNPLTSISSATTSGLPNLDKLRLADIGLNVLPLRLPYEYANLKSLDLSSNQLDALSYDNVQALYSLETLDISSNRFSQLPEYALNFFKTLKLINLYNNPWDCGNCQINALREFLLSEKWRNLCSDLSYDRITCSAPAEFAGKPVALLDRVADCSKYYGAAGLSKSSEMGLLIAGVCGLLLLLGLVAAVGCSYLWPRATYRTHEEKANLSASSSEHSNLQPPATAATSTCKQVERLF